MMISQAWGMWLFLNEVQGQFYVNYLVWDESFSEKKKTLISKEETVHLGLEKEQLLIAETDSEDFYYFNVTLSLLC